MKIAAIVAMANVLSNKCSAVAEAVCQKNVTIVAFQSNAQKRTKIYIRAVNFNEATKKAFR